MSKPVIDLLSNLVKEGKALPDLTAARIQWSQRALGTLSSISAERNYPPPPDLKNKDSNDIRAALLGHLEGLIARLAEQLESQRALPIAAPEGNEVSRPPAPSNSRKVFVVHGHDNEAKETVARYLTNLALQPIVLHEQPSAGRTIIEKFETYSNDIAFAVVLLTPDDIGSSKDSATKLNARARQNVILELGYFMGRLGRTRVCALYRGSVELPSDYQGILYIDLDDKHAWKTRLAQEFVQAKLPIDLAGLLSG